MKIILRNTLMEFETTKLPEIIEKAFNNYSNISMFSKEALALFFNKIIDSNLLSKLVWMHIPYLTDSINVALYDAVSMTTPHVANKNLLGVNENKELYRTETETAVPITVPLKESISLNNFSFITASRYQNTSAKGSIRGNKAVSLEIYYVSDAVVVSNNDSNTLTTASFRSKLINNSVGVSFNNGEFIYYNTSGDSASRTPSTINEQSIDGICIDSYYTGTTQLATAGPIGLSVIGKGMNYNEIKIVTDAIQVLSDSLKSYIK